MAGFGFKAAKAGFFDLSKLQKNADRLHARAQSKFGAFVRRRMKSSIKYKDNRQRKALIERIRAEDTAAKASGGPERAAHRARAKALRRQLAAVQNPVSAPGSPPFAHRGRGGKSPLRELIFFSRDQATNSVVIGPVAFGAKGAAALEGGGAVTVRDPRTGLPRSVEIAARPFARPAGEAEAAKFGDVLRSLVN